MRTNDIFCLENFCLCGIISGKDPTKEDQATQSSSTLWSLDKLRAYFAYSKRFQPELSPDASTVLSQYYQCQRRSDYPNMARTTVRLLQSTIRYNVEKNVALFVTICCLGQTCPGPRPPDVP